jgi:AmmeMemoRadiSam system protein A
MSLSESGRKKLLEICRASIAQGLREGTPLPVDAGKLAEELRPIRATFVTLEIRKRLRGCIGTLEPRLPLAEDVALHAFAAAFEDPRFPPVTLPESRLLDIHVSVLSPRQPIEFTDESDLLAKLRPGMDGVIIDDGVHCATFLPAVWEQLQDPREFLLHLKLKAGIHESAWPRGMKAWRYETESFSD